MGSLNLRELTPEACSPPRPDADEKSRRWGRQKAISDWSLMTFSSGFFPE
jgi:hypothetical protein